MRCLLTRWSISTEADGSARSPRTQKHLNGCLECSTFATQVARIGKSLRSSKKQAPQSVVTEVKVEAMVPVVKGHRLAFGAMLAGAAALTAILIVGGLRPNAETPSSSSPSSPRETAHQSATLAEDNVLDRIAHHIAKNFSEDNSRESLANRDPINVHDVQTLAGDARGGLRYVLRVSGLQAVR